MIAENLFIASVGKSIANIIQEDLQAIGVLDRYKCRVFQNERDLIDATKTYHPAFVIIETCFCGSATTQLLSRLMKTDPTLNVAGFGTQPYSPRFIARFIVTGAELGYLDMRNDSEKFIEGLRSIFREEVVMPHDVELIIDRYAQPSFTDCGLTDRQIDIALLIADGKENKEIAGTLCIAEKTVRNIISQIYMKWNVCNSVQLVRRALCEGIINKDEFCDVEHSAPEIFIDEGGSRYVAKM
jgi:DNA-binding NarL/FixJ family response regulator